MSDDELRMSFTEHLGELRDRLIRCAFAVAIGVVICYIGSDYIFAALAWPIEVMGREIEGVEILPDPAEKPVPVVEGSEGESARPEALPAPEGSPTAAAAPEAGIDPATEGAGWLTLHAVEPYTVRLKIVGDQITEVKVLPGHVGETKASATWVTLNPLEPIIVKFKIAGYGGLFLALPYILFQLCAFIFPGLHEREKRAARFMIFGGAFLAFVGVLVAYFGVFPFVLPYLADFVPAHVETQLRMNETVGMIVMGLLGFAIAFQFPMIVLVLVYVGVLTPETLKAYRKIVIVGLAIVSAILTPPDPFTMTMMLVPLYTLYECSIWISYIIVRRRASGK